MHVDTGEFRAIQAQAAEVPALRRALILLEAIIDEAEVRAEARGFERGRAGRHARPRGAQSGHLRLVSGGRR